MNALSRRERNRVERRAKILDAALTVFSQEGYSGASMDAIAKAAGLTKPTLYHHFPSKDVLFKAMMTAPKDVMMLAFDSGENGDLVERLHGFAWAYADVVMKPEFLALARLIIGEAQRFPDTGRAYQASGPDRVLEGLAAFLSEQRDQGRLAFEHSELAAEDFWGLILSAPRNRALHVPDTTYSRSDLARYVNNGLCTFLRAYSTDPAGDIARLNVICRQTKP